jgi:hypothetical protein
MSEPNKTPPPRKTAAVTIAGFLLLLPAAAFAYGAFFFAFSQIDIQVQYPTGVDVVGAAIFGYAGLATIRRWRGWRIWAGTIAWGLIALVVLNLFKTPPPPGTDRSFELPVMLGVIAIAVFVLIAKRLERRPDFAAVFDD